jgi:hypothetical protein
MRGGADMGVSSRTRIVAVSVFAFANLAVASADARAEVTYEALRSARPDGTKVHVNALTLERDVFRFVFESGEFHLLAPLDGKVVGAVFLGKGRFEMTPASENERRHLGFLTHDEALQTLRDDFTSLVLLFTDGTAEQLAGAGPHAPGAPDPSATKALDEAAKLSVRKLGLDVPLRLLEDRLNPQTGRSGVFVATWNGAHLPPMVAAIDPLGIESFLLDSSSLMGSEESALLADDKDRGRYWYLSHLAAEVREGRTASCRPKALADASHYSVETRIRRNADVDGVTTIRFRPLLPGLRVLPFDLAAKLRVRSAVLLPPGEGAKEVPLQVIQADEDSGGAAALVFPDPVEDEVTVRIAYAGNEVLEDQGDGNFAVHARTMWYPNLGAFRDRASYELTYRTPAKNQIVSVGVPAGSAIEGDQLVSHFRSDVDLPVAGFNYGTFRPLEKKDEETGMTLRVYTNPGTPDVINDINNALRQGAVMSPSEAVDEAASSSGYRPGTLAGVPSLGNIDTARLASDAMADAMNGSRVYHARFGALSQKSIAITQQSQWDFGQSWPSLIFLPYAAFLPWNVRELLGIRNDGQWVELMGLHEMAHQWWGSSVGWESYRDAWLSEGFAEFSAGLAVHEMRGWGAYDAYLEGLRRRIVNKTRSAAMPSYKAGAIVQGFRLETSRTPASYFNVVYEKGAYVLHMLRMMMRDGKSKAPDERFLALMRDFLTTFAGRNPSTADFQALVERHMIPELNATRDGKMNWFFDQWVRGAEIPRYVVKVDVEKAAEEGKYRLHGTIEQQGVSESFLALVPIYADFGKNGAAQIALAPFRGSKAQPVDATIALPEKPKGILVNAHHEILALD